MEDHALKHFVLLETAFFTSTFQTRSHVHARGLQADAVLQLSPAVTLVEAKAPVDPKVTPV